MWFPDLFVVPSSFELLLLAEQTMATLCSSRLGLHGQLVQTPGYDLRNIPDDFIDNVQRKLPNAGTAKFLDHPFCR